MTLIGSALSMAAVAIQSSLLLMGHLTPFAIFLPGFFITFAQGVSMPYAQAGAMGVEPKLAGTASGIGVFMQNMLGAICTQIYGLLADGTVFPLVLTASVSGLLGVAAGAVPFWLKRRADQAR